MNFDVLEFYKELPFNYYSTAALQAEQIRERNVIESQIVLEDILYPGINVLDVGCGAGLFANSFAYYYDAAVTGVDFNPVAIERARDVAAILGVDVELVTADLCDYGRDVPFDLVFANGVLMCVDDFVHAIKHCVKLTKKDGYFFCGLYSKYGREPFIDYFHTLKSQGLSERQLFQKYRELHTAPNDDTHAYSWFRDQVLHPRDIHHTMEEVYETLEEEQMELIRTSINRFEPIETLDAIFAMEKKLSDTGRERLAEGRYYPGFFTFLSKKCR